MADLPLAPPSTDDAHVVLWALGLAVMVAGLLGRLILRHMQDLKSEQEKLRVEQKEEREKLLAKLEAKDAAIQTIHGGLIVDNQKTLHAVSSSQEKVATILQTLVDGSKSHRKP